MKRKYFLLGIIVTLLLIFIVGIINTFISFNNIIYVQEVPKYDEKVKTINDNIDKIKDEECSSAIKKALDRVDDTYYLNNISIKDYYNNYNKNNTTFSDFIYNSINTCNIDSDDSSSIIDLLFASRVYPDSVANRYRTSYQLKLSDYINYKSTYEINDNIGTYSNKEMELKTIYELVNEVLDEKSV